MTDISFTREARGEHDPANRLPEAAREKLFAIRDQHENLKAISRAAYERSKELALGCQRSSARIDELVGPRHNLKPTHPMVEDEQKKLTATRALLAKKQAEVAEKRERAAPIGNLVRRIENYVADMRGDVTVAPPTPLPKITRQIGEHVAEIRKRIEKHREAIREAIDAPIPSKEAKARATAHVAALAEEGQPDIVGLLEGASTVQFPTMSTGHAAIMPGGVVEAQEVPHSLGLVCWLFRDQIVAALHAEIDEIADDDGALTDADRAARITASKRALLADERVEEALIALAAEQGQIIQRREDADPRAVLGLADNMREASE